MSHATKYLFGANIKNQTQTLFTKFKVYHTFLFRNLRSAKPPYLELQFKIHSFSLPPIDVATKHPRSIYSLKCAQDISIAQRKLFTGSLSFQRSAIRPQASHLLYSLHKLRCAPRLWKGLSQHYLVAKLRPDLPKSERKNGTKKSPPTSSTSSTKRRTDSPNNLTHDTTS